MVSFFKSWRARTRPIDEYLTEYLSYEYKLTPPEMEKLHFVKGNERIANKGVSLFRIYDPAQVSMADGKVTYASLDQHRTAVLFEGRFAPNGNISEIKDLRKPV